MEKYIRSLINVIIILALQLVTTLAPTATPQVSVDSDPSYGVKHRSLNNYPSYQSVGFFAHNINGDLSLLIS